LNGERILLGQLLTIGKKKKKKKPENPWWESICKGQMYKASKQSQPKDILKRIACFMVTLFRFLFAEMKIVERNKPIISVSL